MKKKNSHFFFINALKKKIRYAGAAIKHTFETENTNTITYTKYDNTTLTLHAPFMPFSVYLFVCKHIGIEKKDVIPWYQFYQNFEQFVFHFKAWNTFWSTPVFNSRLYFLH